jgi:inward rectifier potassium channel
MHPGIGLGPGVARYDWGDPYHVALALPWRGFLLLTMAYYLLVNLFFAALYTLQPGSVSNMRPGYLSDAFFFSVQTFATVGYGAMSPQTLYGHVISATEIFVGLMSVAVIAGMVFVRFSRPRSRLAFARNLVIGPVDGGTALSARIVNRRLNPLFHVEARMVLITRHRREAGSSVWRIRDLKLLHERSLVEMMSWTLVHMIDPASPLNGLDAADLAQAQAQVMVSIAATEGTTMAPLHAMHLFQAADILFGHAFAELISEDAAGHPRFDLERADQVVWLEPTPAPDRPGG